MMPQPDFAAGTAVPSAQPSMPSENTIAWVFGQPVTDVPQDLFIPPDALKVVLGSFQGPLDLLLYLIRKQNIDVLDIPMVKSPSNICTTLPKWKPISLIWRRNTC